MGSFILHRRPRHVPPIAVGGAGAFLFTEDGRRILDGSGGAAVSCLGHGHPAVVAAILEQAAALSYAHSSFFSSAPAEELAQHLVGSRPGGLSRAYFVSGGSEATEAAIKLARHFFIQRREPKRSHFISRRGSYHGATIGALALSGNRWRRNGYEPLLPNDVTHVSPAYAYRDQAEGESEQAYCDRLIEEIEVAFRRIGPERVAAFVAEPVVGATLGAVAAPPGYFERVKQLCRRHGALLIMDEVMCGMGRTGTRHAWEQEAAAPDIQMIAKGLAGGYQPIGAVLLAEHVADQVEAGADFAHGHTYMAHPIACAAALAVQRTVDDQNLLSAVTCAGQVLREGLVAAFGDHPHVGDIRGRGLLYAIEIVERRDTKRPFASTLNVSTRIKDEAFRMGLACYPGNGCAGDAGGDHILLAPPFITSADELDEIVTTLARAVESVTVEVRASS